MGEGGTKRKEKRFSYDSAPLVARVLLPPRPPSREQDINLLLSGLSVGQGSRGSRFLFYYLETARETNKPHPTSCFSFSLFFFSTPSTHGLGTLCSVLIRRNFDTLESYFSSFPLSFLYFFLFSSCSSRG